MSIEKLTLKKSLQKNVLTMMPVEEEKDVFINRLEKMIKDLKANSNESEEFQKNIVSDFLKMILPNNLINTKGRTDLAIYGSLSGSSNPKVIMEFKSLNNSSEMLSENRYNTKAFQEIIHYYLRERIVYKNLEIKKCIITNGLSWFTIDSKEIEKYFYKNKNLVELYIKWNEKKLSSDTTEFLYNNIISDSIDKAIEKGIKISHFNLENALIKNSEVVTLKTNFVTNLYRYYSPENLLSMDVATDSNKLNRKFYDELLYLMGLEEVKIKGASAKVIRRLDSKNKQPGSLIENAIDRITTIKDYTESHVEDISMELIVTWINRILFIKLLEGQLITFNNNEKFKILSKEKINSFEDIYDLFFGILAKRKENRLDRLNEKFDYIPYLNSSLFEESLLEKNEIGIDRLREYEIDLYKNTVLKDPSGNKKSGQINFIEYLFQFLDVYDFSTAVRHNKNSKNNLINASVLGLIFEKINGYSDGSFYTPGRITMYMSKQSLYRVVINKINETKGWNCKSLDDIRFKITDINQAKEVSNIIDTIKICDPAVGSGHFLVSILNEIIALKSELKVLFDTENRVLTNINCTVVNDELVIHDFNGDNYVYKKNNGATKNIQKAVFHQKKYIIENCLFGADINPNSVNICRLRLWIELLKNAYYYFDNEINEDRLSTLPNIDINIKVGNSLVSKYGLDFDIDASKNNLDEYLSLVKDYKTTNDKNIKKSIEEKLINIKSKVRDSFITPAGKEYKKLSSQLQRIGQTDLFESKDKSKMNEIEKINSRLKELQEEINQSKTNLFFKNALEWRMEFPELLDVKGDFIGFDLIIGNPPYIFARNKSFTEKDKKYFKDNYKVAEYQVNTYHLFIELGWNLLRKGGTFSFIVPNNILTIQSNSIIREFLIKNTGNLHLLNSLDKVFEDANVDNAILTFEKSIPNSIYLAEMKNDEVVNIDKVPFDFFGHPPVFSFSKVKYKDYKTIYEKISNSKFSLEEISDVKSGIKAYEEGKGQPIITEEMKINRIYHSDTQIDSTYKKYLKGEDVDRYNNKWSGQWIKYGSNLAAKRKEEYFSGPRILVRQIPRKNSYAIPAMFINEEYINDINSIIIRNITLDPHYVLGILNSKIITIWFVIKFDKFQRGLFPQFKVNELAEFPIPEANSIEYLKIIEIVKDIINNGDNEEKSLMIDEIIMDILNFNDEEKVNIRNFELGN